MADDVDALIELGCDLYDERRFAEAEKCFHLASDLGSPEGAFDLGNALSAQARWTDAVSAYQLALERGESAA